MSKYSSKEKHGLYFLKNSGNISIGSGNAVLTAFKDRPYWRTARETVQNSIDAVADKKKPVKVFFNHKIIDISEIPGNVQLL